MVYDYIDLLTKNIKLIYNTIKVDEQLKFIEMNKCMLFSDDFKVILKGSSMMKQYLENFNDKQKFNDWMYNENNNIQYLVDSVVRVLDAN